MLNSLNTEVAKNWMRSEEIFNVIIIIINFLNNFFIIYIFLKKFWV